MCQQAKRHNEASTNKVVPLDQVAQLKFNCDEEELEIGLEDDPSRRDANVDVPLRKLPRSDFPEWWCQPSGEQFVKLSCCGRSLIYVQRKFSREKGTADWVSRSGKRVYYDCKIFKDELYGETCLLE